MDFISIVKILLWAIGLWVGIVFVPYMISVAGFKAKSPTILAHVLYGLWFVALFLYAMILSPIAYLMQVNSVGFYIGLGLLVLIVIAIIVTGVNHKAKRGGK